MISIQYTKLVIRGENFISSGCNWVEFDKSTDPQKKKKKVLRLVLIRCYALHKVLIVPIILNGFDDYPKIFTKPFVYREYTYMIVFQL
jgi:hypothetical protein